LAVESEHSSRVGNLALLLPSIFHSYFKTYTL